MTANVKESIQYGTAVIMVLSGVVLAFLSFFLNNYDISDGVLWYIAQALVYAGGIFGVSLFFKTKLGEFKTNTEESIKKAVREAVRKEDDE